MKQIFLLMMACICFTTITLANNLVISGTPSFSSANQTLTFTMAWDNSWSINSGPTNWDGVWIFVKRQNCSGNNPWVHQKLSVTSTDHSAKLASNSATSTDVQVDAVSDGMGVFVRRIGTNVVGNVLSQIVTIKLGGTNPTITTASSDNFEVLGIEVVYVPQGQFYAGDGRTTNTSNFSVGTTTQPVLINADKQANGLGTALNYTSNVGYGSPIPLPSTYPLGYNGFYCMKYEATTGIFVEYLNTLTYDQQASILAQNGSANLPNIIGSYFNQNNSYYWTTRVTTIGTYNTIPAIFSCTSPWAIEGYLSWRDAISFLDWSGLRPMTEFEYEKSCRGTVVSVANEYPWGSTVITLNNTIAQNWNNTTYYNYNGDGQCFYCCWDGSAMRGGGFASSTTNRTQSGSTYYGIMDMAGNQTEQCIGGPSGYNYSTFTTINGDGVLTALGQANVVGWPTSGGQNSGSTFRGGYFNIGTTTQLQTSDRYYSISSNIPNNASKWKYNGARGVRSFSY